MGISIKLLVSCSVTKKEWNKVYEESLLLVDKFQLMDKREIDIDGIMTNCLVPTQERKFVYGWGSLVGWAAIGDYKSMKIAEEYFLDKNLVKDNNVNKNAGDAILGAMGIMFYECKAKKFKNVYDLWGDKTQGEPYHMYLLAIACLIEDRLKSKVFIIGDITRGQCAEAVKLANKHLEEKIKVPARCDMKRLFERINKLDLSDSEKLDAFNTFYLGNADKKFGKFISTHFTKEVCLNYWKEEFKDALIGTLAFDNKFNNYILWGFDLEELCKLVKYTDKKGNKLYKNFIIRVLDAKLHIKEKDCRDSSKIDQDLPEPYGIGALFAQAMLIGARNKCVDRYVPIEDIRNVFVKAFKDKCDVNAIIDDYLDKEKKKNAKAQRTCKNRTLDLDEDDDVAALLNDLMDMKKSELMEEKKKYDIDDFDELRFYKKGNTMEPELMEGLGKLYTFCQGLLKESEFEELMNKSAQSRCVWLIEQNQYILIRDIDWKKIFSEIKNNDEIFARYYPMVRVRLDNKDLALMLKAMILNDALYKFCKSKFT